MNGAMAHRRGPGAPAGRASDHEGGMPVEPRWTLVHSLGMLASIAAACMTGDPRVVAVGGALSILAFVAIASSRWTESGRLGAANAITLGRLALVAALGALPRAGPVASLLVLGALVLDGLDGWVARRLGQASPFGATFDMETDALLVAVAAVKLAVSGRLGVWILVPGGLRYAYVIVLYLAPGAREEPPRTRFGRYVCGILVAGLAASLWPLEPVHRPLAVIVTVLTVHSFARSLLWSFGKARRPARGLDARPEKPSEPPGVRGRA